MLSESSLLTLLHDSILEVLMIISSFGLDRTRIVELEEQRWALHCVNIFHTRVNDFTVVNCSD